MSTGSSRPKIALGLGTKGDAMKTCASVTVQRWGLMVCGDSLGRLVPAVVEADEVPRSRYDFVNGLLSTCAAKHLLSVIEVESSA